MDSASGWVPTSAAQARRDAVTALLDEPRKRSSQPTATVSNPIETDCFNTVGPTACSDSEPSLPVGWSNGNAAVPQSGRRSLTSQATLYSWTRWTGTTFSTDTGPQNGATYREGDYYFYMETSSPRQPGDQFLLTYSAAAGNCSQYGIDTVAFKYHMYGSDIDTLLVAAGTYDPTASGFAWTKSGAQGNLWFAASVTLGTATQGADAVSFIGRRGASWAGDIAIDEVRECRWWMLNGSAPDTHTHTHTH